MLTDCKMTVLTCLCQTGFPSAWGPGGDVSFTMTHPLWLACCRGNKEKLIYQKNPKQALFLLGPVPLVPQQTQGSEPSSLQGAGREEAVEGPPFNTWSSRCWELTRGHSLLCEKISDTAGRLWIAVWRCSWPSAAPGTCLWFGGVSLLPWPWLQGNTVPVSLHVHRTCVTLSKLPLSGEMAQLVVS